jgi:DNA polymerase elongation subunit (family B)
MDNNINHIYLEDMNVQSELQNNCDDVYLSDDEDNDSTSDNELIDDIDIEYDDHIDTIKYTKQIDYIDYQIPQRNNFTLNELSDSLDARIEAGQSIHIHPIAIYEGDESIKTAKGYQKRFQISLYSVLIDGRKVEVIIENIPLYIDIEINTKYSEAKHYRYFIEKVIGLENSSKIIKDEIVLMYPFNGFVQNKIEYLRIYFNDSMSRKSVLNELIKKNIITASDDTRLLYAAFVRRHKLNMCGWNVISWYTNTKCSKKTSYVLKVNYDNIVAMTDKQIEEKESSNNITIFSKNRTLVMAYDIETHSLNNTGEAPDPAKPDSYVIFNIGMSFHWFYDPNPFKQICLTTKPSMSREDRDTVYCKTEYELLEAFLTIFESMSPDILTHFNGGHFDTPCIYHKLKSHDMLMLAKKMMSCKIPKYNDTEVSLGKDTNKWNKLIHEEHMKITADESIGIFRFNIEGVIEIDVMAIMRQLNPKAQVGRFYSLNFFLKLCNLDSKDPMNYKDMDKIFIDVTSVENMQKMDLVCKYCVVDAVRCQQLLCKQTVINDLRELCSTTYLGLYEGVYRANGMKVRNLLAAQAHDRDIAFSHIKKIDENEIKGQYPGALVFYPKRGWHDILPITGLDFSSLYPSLMMAYNLSPEMLVRTEEQKNALELQGYTLHEIKFMFGGELQHGWFVRHNNVMVRNSQRKNIFTNETAPCLYNEQMGLFPSVLKQLFDDRKIYKKKFVALSEEKEHMEAEHSKKLDSNGNPLSIEILKEDPHYIDLCFMRSKMESKQKGKKVVMNTFYGESGNSLSPIREILVAGGTTSMGQYCLKLVADYVQTLGCKLIYGDTDSTYITCPEECYKEVEQSFQKGEISLLDSAKKKVEITMEKMKEIRNKVNNMLKENNGTEFLAMAYEEVLFPSQFNGKKMYSGIAHENVPNFFPKDIFKRGGEYSKGGRSQLLYKMWDEYTRNRYQPDKWSDDTLTIVENLIRQIYATKWDLDYFSKKSKYRPNKQNISVLTFVKRMIENRERYAKDPEKLSLFPVIEPGDNLTTLIIKPTLLHDFRGKKINLSIGDRMEYPEVYTYYNNKNPDSMKIDLRYYLDSGIINTFARFICHYPQFQPTTGNFDDDSIDTYSVKQAESYLNSLCDQLDGINKETVHLQNTVYKQYYKKTTTIARNITSEKIGAEKLKLIDNVELDSVYKITSYYDQLYEECVEEANRLFKDKWGANIIKYILDKNKSFTIHTIKYIYKNTKINLLVNKIKLIVNQIDILKNDIKSQLAIIIPILIDNDTKISNYIMDLRKLDDLSVEVIDEDEIKDIINWSDENINAINTLYAKYNQLKTNIRLHTQYRDLYNAIDQYFHDKPTNTDIINTINNIQFTPIDHLEQFT